MSEGEEARLHLFFFFDFGGGAGFLPAVVVDVVSLLTPPSFSERLSSTSTVWVMASVPVGAGGADAGAMVCVAGALLLGWRLQPNGTRIRAAVIRTNGVAALFK